MEIYLIALAAGFSRRYGKNKLMEPVEGEKMYRRLFSLLGEVRQRHPGIGGIAVVTQYEEILEEAARRGFTALWNAESASGIASSLQCGLRAMLELCGKGPAAFCFFVSDQPYLRADTVVRFLEEFAESGKGIGRLCYGGREGNPVIFAGCYAKELLGLTGDRGGSRVVKRHPGDVFRMEASCSRELEDMDVR